eukprot:TRINITY_DN3713_c0_g1_i3.p1 TRINITY_DN3713_c0_g1~~TRINITY_DN3713_c0_g1_i3.p1  ORF type:complete len:217 (+),score=45.80 TRINITY_DN3713_c0_g1_i3:417-1067(+)
MGEGQNSFKDFQFFAQNQQQQSTASEQQQQQANIQQTAKENNNLIDLFDDDFLQDQGQNQSKKEQNQNTEKQAVVADIFDINQNQEQGKQEQIQDNQKAQQQSIQPNLMDLDFDITEKVFKKEEDKVNSEQSKLDSNFFFNSEKKYESNVWQAFNNQSQQPQMQTNSQNPFQQQSYPTLNINIQPTMVQSQMIQYNASSALPYSKQSPSKNPFDNF